MGQENRLAENAAPFPVCRDSVHTLLARASGISAVHRHSGRFQNCPTQCSPNILSDSSSWRQMRPQATSQVQGCRRDPLAGPGHLPHTDVSSRTSLAPLPKLNLSSKLCLWEGVQPSCVRMQEKWFLLLLQLFHQEAVTLCGATCLGLGLRAQLHHGRPYPASTLASSHPGLGLGAPFQNGSTDRALSQSPRPSRPCVCQVYRPAQRVTPGGPVCCAGHIYQPRDPAGGMACGQKARQRLPAPHGSLQYWSR